MMLSHNPIVEPFALAHATIVTGDKAGTILRNMTIVVGADGRIEQVAPSIETSIPAEYHYLDGTGKIVMPAGHCPTCVARWGHGENSSECTGDRGARRRLVP